MLSLRFTTLETFLSRSRHVSLSRWLGRIMISDLFIILLLVVLIIIQSVNYGYRIGFRHGRNSLQNPAINNNCEKTG